MKIRTSSQATTSTTSISLDWLNAWTITPAVNNGRLEAISWDGDVRRIWRRNASEREQAFFLDVNRTVRGILLVERLLTLGGRHVKPCVHNAKRSRSLLVCCSLKMKTNRRSILMPRTWTRNGQTGLMKSWSTAFEMLPYRLIFCMRFKRFVARKRLLR